MWADILQNESVKSENRAAALLDEAQQWDKTTKYVNALLGASLVDL